MRQRLAPLAICFMSKIEEPVLIRSPLMYCRYIDNCCVITSRQSGMNRCSRLLNQQSQYIHSAFGETGRLLGGRFHEHLASEKRQSLVSPLGKHRRKDYNGTDFEISCTILAFEDNIVARKALEALWIMASDPKINNRNEQLFTTRDLMPFLPSCAI